MIFSLKALLRLSLLGLVAPPFFSPAAADAIAGVGNSRSEERSRILLEGEEAGASSAFLLGKPGTSSALGFATANCDTSALTMVRLDLTSSYQMWKYDSSTSVIQSIACPDKVITVSSSCDSIQVTAKGSVTDINFQKFSFQDVFGFSSDNTTGVQIKSAACADVVLSDGGSSDDARIGSAITMRVNKNDNWLFIDLSNGNNYFHLLREYTSLTSDLDYAASISMSTDGSLIAISGSKSVEGTDKFRGFVRLYNSDMTLLDTFMTESIDEVTPIVTVVISGDGKRLAIGAVFPTGEESLVSGVKVFDLTNKNNEDKYDQIGTIIDAGVMGDLPGLRLDISEDGSKLIVGGRNYQNGRGRVRVYTIEMSANVFLHDQIKLGFEVLGTVGSKDHLGSSVSVSSNGRYMAIGGTGIINVENGFMTGAVQIYDTMLGSPVGDVIYGSSASDATGFSVDLVRIGDMLYVAVASIFSGEDTHPDRGKVDILRLSLADDDTSNWEKVGDSLVGDRGATLDFVNGNYHIGDSFGFSLGLAKMNDNTGGLRVAVGSPFFSNVRESDAYYGVVKLFEYSETSWAQIAYDIVGNSDTSASGTSVALVNGGDTLAIGGGSDVASNGKVVVYAQEETSFEPSSTPSAVPSKEPSMHPSSVPSFQPSSITSNKPSSIPSSRPSFIPSKEPSSMPNSIPSSVPSSQPSSVPSKEPSSVPSNVPSSQPSSVPSEKPSSYPSKDPSSKPSSVPSQPPSYIPSARPSISYEPSSQPSDFGDREFMILSKFKKLTDLDMGGREDKNWCLERLFAAGNNNGEGNPLKMRPCETGNSKQIWFYQRQNKVITNGRNSVNSENPSGFCITRNGKQLVSKQCTALPAGVKTFISEGALNFTQNGSTGSISMKTDNNEFYFAIGSIRIFSRVKLLKKGTENSSFDKWQLRYHGPSEFPSSIPSSNPSDKPSVVPNTVPSTFPSSNPSELSEVPSDFLSAAPSYPPSARPLPSVWLQIGSNIADGDAGANSGYSVSLSADGSTVAIGATGDFSNASSSVRIFQWYTSVWTQVGTTINGEEPRDNSGRSVSLSADGRTVAIGENGYDANGSITSSGRVRIFQLSTTGGDWARVGAAINGKSFYDYFGCSVSLSADGSTVAIGAFGHNGNRSRDIGHVRIFQWSTTGGDWAQMGEDIEGEGADDKSGHSVSLSADGSTVAIGSIGYANSTGRVRIFQWSTTCRAWSMMGADIVGETYVDNFGSSVSLSADGSTVAIGAIGYDRQSSPAGNNIGRVRIYQWYTTEGDWYPMGADLEGEEPGDNFGWSVSMSADGNTVAIGATGNDENGSLSGHVRIFQWSTTGGDWAQMGEDIDGGAQFDKSGQSVSLSEDGSTVAIGANGNGGHVSIYQWK